MISRTILALCALSSTAMGQNASGIHASLDISILEQAKDIYTVEILKFLNNLALPNIDSNDGKDYLHGNHITVSQSAANVLFDVDLPNNALTLTLNKLSANFYTDSFRAHSWIFVAKGHLEVIMDTVNVGLGLSFTTQTLPDGRVVPMVNAVDVLVDINRNDINIKIWGNIWSDFAAAFEIFFKSTIVQLIQDTVKDTLTTTVPAYINTMLATNDGTIIVPGQPNWFLDWQTPAAAIVTANYFELGARGIMYDNMIG